MKTPQLVSVMIVALVASAQTTAQPKATHKVDPLPRDLEIQLARSALPPHLRDNATVYVRQPDKGFEVASKGTNGFHTFVARTGEDTMRGSWPFTEYRDDILYPVAFDAAGARAHMRVFFDIAAMQAKGTAPAELKRLIQDRYDQAVVVPAGIQDSLRNAGRKEEPRMYTPSPPPCTTTSTT
jgi:hypothetical protein